MFYDIKNKDMATTLTHCNAAVQVTFQGIGYKLYIDIL